MLEWFHAGKTLAHLDFDRGGGFFDGIETHVLLGIYLKRMKGKRRLGKYTLLALLAGTGLMFGGCGRVNSGEDGLPLQGALKEGQAEEKTILVGKLQAKVADGYLLLSSEGVRKIDSTKIDLEEWLDQQITVIGQYSGEILYVDEIR